MDGLRRWPWSIAMLAGLLLLVGYASIVRSGELAGDSARFARQQAVWAFLALAGMGVTSRLNYRTLRHFSYLFFGVSIALLLLVYAFPPINGAHRWIRLGPVGLQPSELTKVTFVLALASWLMDQKNYRRLAGLVTPLVLTMIPVLLILKEPDLGTATVFLPVLFAMLLVAGARRSDLAKVAVVGLALLPVLWTQMSSEQRSRVTALWEQTGPGQRPSDDGYQLHQSKRMLAMGGWWGSAVTGSTVDDPAAYRLPESHCDFIFPVVGERFGVFGLGAVLALYALLVWRILAVAAATREPFGRLVAAGIGSLVGVQVLINTGMTVGLLPITGLALPLLSYGGSALVSTGIALGLVLSIAQRPGYEVAPEPFRFAIASPYASRS